MNTDIYCDVCIIILFLQTGRGLSNTLNVITAILNLFLTDEKIFLLYYFSPTAYATNDNTIIHHVYKPDFAVCVRFFHDRMSGPVCHHIGGRVWSSFLSGQCDNLS